MIICEVYSTHINDINQELTKSIHYGECKSRYVKCLSFIILIRLLFTLKRLLTAIRLMIILRR